MLAPSPAPLSTATDAPSATNFLTVSGVAATRLSPAARSCKTAIRITNGPGSGNEEDDDERQDGRDGHHPLEKVDESAVGLLMSLHLVRGIHRESSPVR